MTIPSFLKPGDKIAIVSPAGKVNPEFVKTAGLNLENMGFEVITANHALDRHFQYSSDDRNRIEDFQEMLDRDDISAILCSRGGYGSIRIIDRLDFGRFRKKPKWIIGFSDITVIHACLNNVLGISSIHGPMTKTIADAPDSGSVQNLIRMLTGKSISYQLPQHNLNRPGKCMGSLAGGNLAILTSLTGTGYDFDPGGKILFIEDTGEYLYRIDRMMWQLKLAGKFRGLQAMIVGQFSDVKDNDSPFGRNAYEIIAEHVSGYDFPVYFGFPAGHEDVNFPLMLNNRIRISSESVLTF